MLSSFVLLLTIGCSVGHQTSEVALSQRAASSRCPLGFIKNKSSCYLFSRINATHFEAQSSCGYFDSRLAEINSKDEEDFIREYLKKNGEGQSHCISGTDLRKEGIWTWENPVELVSYLNWSTGQPDNHEGKEHCLHLKAEYGYMMNDGPCDATLYFVCEQNL